MSSDEISIVSWNIHHQPSAWELLDSFGSDAVLIQEATKPPIKNAFQVVAPPSGNWRLINGSGAHATAIVITNPEFYFHPVPVTPLGWNSPDSIPSSHPGQFTIIETKFGARPLYLISLYGFFRDDLSDASIHRAVSDLSDLFSGKNEILIAGDLNVYRDHTLGKEGQYSRYLDRYKEVFSRFASVGLELLGPFGKAPLENCPCYEATSCRHVRTYRHGMKEDSKPLQLDFVFGTNGLSEKLVSCEVLDTTKYWEVSDHAPIQITIKTPMQ